MQFVRLKDHCRQHFKSQLSYLETKLYLLLGGFTSQHDSLHQSDPEKCQRQQNLPCLQVRSIVNFRVDYLSNVVPRIKHWMHWMDARSTANKEQAQTDRAALTLGHLNAFYVVFA